MGRGWEIGWRFFSDLSMGFLCWVLRDIPDESQKGWRRLHKTNVCENHAASPGLLPSLRISFSSFIFLSVSSCHFSLCFSSLKYDRAYGGEARGANYRWWLFHGNGPCYVCVENRQRYQLFSQRQRPFDRKFNNLSTSLAVIGFMLK